jgi:hypothetical protein
MYSHYLSHSSFQGIHVSFLLIVIQYGVVKDMCSMMQRAGRVGRDFSKVALFLLMYEPWLATIPIPPTFDRSISNQIDPDRPLNPLPRDREPTKQERTGARMYVLIQAKLCIRAEFGLYGDDETPEREFSFS